MTVPDLNPCNPRNPRLFFFRGWEGLGRTGLGGDTDEHEKQHGIRRDLQIEIGEAVQEDRKDGAHCSDENRGPLDRLRAEKTAERTPEDDENGNPEYGGGENAPLCRRLEIVVVRVVEEKLGMKRLILPENITILFEPKFQRDGP